VQETPISIAAVSGDDLRARRRPFPRRAGAGHSRRFAESEGPSQTGRSNAGQTSSGRQNSATVGSISTIFPWLTRQALKMVHVVIDPDRMT